MKSIRTADEMGEFELAPPSQNFIRTINKSKLSLDRFELLYRDGLRRNTKRNSKVSTELL